MTGTPSPGVYLKRELYRHYFPILALASLSGAE